MCVWFVRVRVCVLARARVYLTSKSFFVLLLKSNVISSLLINDESYFSTFNFQFLRSQRKKEFYRSKENNILSFFIYIYIFFSLRTRTTIITSPTWDRLPLVRTCIISYTDLLWFLSSLDRHCLWWREPPYSWNRYRSVRACSRHLPSMVRVSIHSSVNTSLEKKSGSIVVVRKVERRRVNFFLRIRGKIIFVINNRFTRIVKKENFYEFDQIKMRLKIFTARVFQVWEK